MLGKVNFPIQEVDQLTIVVYVLFFTISSKN